MASWKYQMVDNNQLTTISDLDTHTIYTIRVQALTSVGPGPLSTPVQIKTQQGVPSQPEMLTAIDIGETTVTLQWNKPIHSAENILSYELYWNDTYAQVGEHVLLPSSSSFFLRSPFPLSLFLSLSLSLSLFPESKRTITLNIRVRRCERSSGSRSISGEASSQDTCHRELHVDRPLSEHPVLRLAGRPESTGGRSHHDTVSGSHEAVR